LVMADLVALRTEQPHVDVVVVSPVGVKSTQPSGVSTVLILTLAQILLDGRRHKDARDIRILSCISYEVGMLLGPQSRRQLRRFWVDYASCAHGLALLARPVVIGRGGQPDVHVKTRLVTGVA